MALITNIGAVTLNQAGLEQFFRDPFGPIGLMLADKADKVAERARENASGTIIGIRSGDLLGGITARVGIGSLGLQAVVFTRAEHRGFGYPAFHDQHHRPWLTRALAFIT